MPGKRGQTARQQTVKTSRLILPALLLGIVLGVLFHSDEAWTATAVSICAVITDIFLRLIKMIIAPLVLSTLVMGIARLDDLQSVGRIAGRSLLWFLGASVFSLLLGMALVNSFQPGAALHLSELADQAKLPASDPPLTLAGFISHLVPRSIFESLSQNEILQIVVFSLFFGTACASLGAKAASVVQFMESLADIMLKMTQYVMGFAPLAVMAAITSVIAQHGIGIIGNYGTFMLEFYLALLLLCLSITAAGRFLLGPSVYQLLGMIREPLILALGTASSESAFPKLLEQLKKFGCNERVSGMVLPLGYSFNLDGSMMYMTFAVIFIAQAYGITMPLHDQLVMLLMLLVTSKGIAGVPRASLVVISATLATFHIPEEGIVLLLGIDQLLDMGRSATNVLGNSMAVAVIDRWEKTAVYKSRE